LINRLFKIVLILFVINTTYLSQEVIKVDKRSSSLSEQFESTFNIAKEHDNFWIAYSIEANTNLNISIGSFTLYNNDLKISLRDIIVMTPRYAEFKEGNRKSNGRSYGRSVHIMNGRCITDDEADKETALLFRYDRNSTDISDFAEIDICNMSLYVDLDDFPIYWLHKIESSKSADFVITMYNNSNNWFAREELVSAIGIHVGLPQVLPVLKQIVYGKGKDDMKENALFWLGVQNTNESFSILKDVINDNKFGEIREDAVMSLGNMEMEDALDELIKIAKTSNESNLREHAIYGLGNKAVIKAEEALKDFIENDPDIEIKKMAIYALADRTEENIPYLIELAKSNKSLSIRKTAIYSLSNFEDERAIDALIELAKENY